MDQLLSRLMEFLFMLPSILIALSVHECAHGYMAYKLGDNTARNFGRLTLNPLKHIDVLGFVSMLLFRFGWAKPVPVDSRYFKKPKRDMALVGLAGPVSNILLGFIGVVIEKVFEKIYLSRVTNNIYDYISGNVGFWDNFLIAAVNFFYLFAILNIGLAIFNLIPIPPLDGSKILYAFLPQKAAFWMATHERYLSIILLLIIIFDVNLPLISAAMDGLYNLFYNLVSHIL